MEILFEVQQGAIWICRSRTNNSKINTLHEKYLCIIYSHEHSWFA